MQVGEAQGRSPKNSKLTLGLYYLVHHMVAVVDSIRRDIAFLNS